MLTGTPFHIWERFYLPIFLFRVGLLTLLYMDSLIVLVKPCPSLTNMLKFSIVPMWPVVVWWSHKGEDALRCSFYLLPNVQADSPIYPSLQSTLSHLCQYIIQLLPCFGSLSFSDTSIFLIILVPLKYVLMPYLPFTTLTQALPVWYEYVSLVFVVVVVDGILGLHSSPWITIMAIMTLIPHSKHS